MLLASVSNIVSDLGFDSMTDITFAVTQAVDAAEAELASVLESGFEQGSFVDTFYVDSPPFRGSVEFRLSHGLVTALTQVLANTSAIGFNSDPISVWSASTWPFSNMMGAGNIDTTANVQFDTNARDKGVMRDFLSGYNQTYVRVSYTAGFPADGSDATSYDLAVVPKWLQQAAKTLALIRLADSPALTEANIKLDTSMLKAQYSAIISRKIRYAPLSILPL